MTDEGNQDSAKSKKFVPAIGRDFEIGEHRPPRRSWFGLLLSTLVMPVFQLFSR